MGQLSSHLTECTRCPHRSGHTDRPVVCMVDGHGIDAHAATGHCPHPAGPRFGTSRPPADWGSAEAPADPDYDPEAGYAVADSPDPETIEHRRSMCAGCDHLVEMADAAARCKLRGGGTRTCARCWAIFARGPDQCPAGKWTKNRSPLDG